MDGAVRRRCLVTLLYYDLLDRLRTEGDWETWLDFFLTGVRDTADQAAPAARRILLRRWLRMNAAMIRTAG